MAARPLPPGRRGRGASRAASGLHNLPEPKLLGVPASVAVAPPPSSSASAPAPPASATSLAALSPSSVSIASTAPSAAAPSPSSPNTSVKSSVAQVVAALEKDALDTTPLPTTASRHHPPPPPVHVPTPPPPPPAAHAPLPQAASSGNALSAASEPAVGTPAPPPAPPVSALEPTSVVSPPASRDDGVPTAIDELHPFRLLLPVESVPEVPASVECVYDDTAVALQKAVLRVLKKVLSTRKKTDKKLQLEDFKINSRLFGNNFMDATEYFDSLVADVGAVRALQLVPSLGRLQADYMKRTGLLLAARTYRLRHLAALETQCAAMRAASVETAPGPHSEPSSAVVAPSEGEIAQPVAALVAPEAVGADSEVGLVPDERLLQSVEAGETIAVPSADTVALAVLLGAAAAEAGAPFSKEPTAEVMDSFAAPVVAANKTGDRSDHGAPNVAWHAASEVVTDALVASHSPQAAAKLLEAESASDSESEEEEEATSATVVAPESTVEALAESFVADLPLAFQHLFASDEAVISTPVQATPTAVAADSSLTDAENLFGERFSVGSASSETTENLFGERIYESKPSVVEPPTVSNPAPSNTTNHNSSSSQDGAASGATSVPHSQPLFGFATAGADTDSDSDSDDSGFSSP